MKLNSVLQRGIDNLDLRIPASSQIKLMRFLEFIQKWNRVFNLTAVYKLEAMISYHLMDSLSIVHYIAGPRILDIGSGAGLPGIPLSIVLPQHHFVLLDSQGKKARFLLQAKRELDLPNIDIVQERVECYHPLQLFNTITVRAFGSARDIIKQSRHLLLPQGQWLLMRGRVKEQEFTEVENTIEIVPLQVPGLHQQRNVVVIQLL